MKPLWRCPKCGHRFVTANLWHSCGRYDLARHFTGRDPLVRRLFDRFMRVVRAQGRVTMYPQKTRIICMVRVRFAGATTRKSGLDVHLWLKRRAEHAVLRKVEFYPPGAYVHYFRFGRLDEFDGSFSALVKEAYRIGREGGGAGKAG
jgi:hypothetical protein